MSEISTLYIDGRPVRFENEKNLLEVIRKSGVEIPTFCYHSDLSVYGACRLCMVDVEGMGLVASCSTKPEEGMKIKTNTNEVREIRKTVVELLLASHDHNCPTCQRSSSCKLQNLSRRMGITEIEYENTNEILPVDKSSFSIVRDPNKCVLCGDCVRMCREVQGVGAIDFAHRGANVTVEPAFGKPLGSVECVECGQCIQVCPTGALSIKSNVEDIWKVINDPSKTVIAEIAPAVRVAIGEGFGIEDGSVTTGQIVSALKMLGFNKVYDTSFAADLTAIEEATEFLNRFESGENLPQFTSCCPAWVKFAEQYYPELLSNLSTCRSPQQMFGSLAKNTLPEKLNIDEDNLVVVSIMPCTAKKFESKRPELSRDGKPDVDHVLTTTELGLMISEAGIDFKNLTPESLDMPMGFKTGAGIIFGASGGVSEAVLRFAAEKISGIKLTNVDFHAVRGKKGFRETEIVINDKTLKLAIVHGLKNAEYVAEMIKSGESKWDLIEVMACPGGCVGGAGQPIAWNSDTKDKRCDALFKTDKNLQLHKAQENPYIKECYETILHDGANGKKAHELLHTEYKNRKRITKDGMPLTEGADGDKISVSICVGTNCYMKGSQDIAKKLVHYLEENNLEDKVAVKATFCLEKCNKGPSVVVNGSVLEKATFEKVLNTVKFQLETGN